MYRLSNQSHFGATRLAPIIGVKTDLLFSIFELSPSAWYIPWEKKKRDGTPRPMMTPCDLLLEIQQAIVAGPFQRIKLSPIAQGGVRGRSIHSCVMEHAGSSSAVCLDLEDAFGSVGLLANHHEFGIDRKTTDWPIFKSLIEAYRNVNPWFERYYLPQGAATSPGAFNISCRGLDRRLKCFAERLGGRITRYVDDIVFSWDRPVIPIAVLNALIRIIQETELGHSKRNFWINSEKSIVVQHGNRQGVPIRCAGVNLINDRPGLPKAELRHFRLALYSAYMSGHRGQVDGILGHIINVYRDDLPWQILGVVEKFDPERFRGLFEPQKSK